MLYPFEAMDITENSLLAEYFLATESRLIHTKLIKDALPKNGMQIIWSERFRKNEFTNGLNDCKYPIFFSPVNLYPILTGYFRLYPELSG